MRPDFLNEADPFTSIEAAQAAVDAWVADHNAERPHQALDDQFPVTPAERFTPIGQEQRELVELWLPPTLNVTSSPGHQPVPGPEPESGSEPGPAPTTDPELAPDVLPAPAAWSGGPIEFDQMVPSSGNMCVAQKQFWLGPARAGMTVRFWASTDVIHLSIAGARVKSVRFAPDRSRPDPTRLSRRGQRRPGTDSRPGRGRRRRGRPGDWKSVV